MQIWHSAMFAPDPIPPPPANSSRNFLSPILLLLNNPFIQSSQTSHSLPPPRPYSTWPVTWVPVDIQAGSPRALVTYFRLANRFVFGRLLPVLSSSPAQQIITFRPSQRSCLPRLRHVINQQHGKLRSQKIINLRRCISSPGFLKQWGRLGTV